MHSCLARAVSLSLFLVPLLLIRPLKGESYVFTTIAGSPGTFGNIDGEGNVARFWGAGGLAIDGSGNLFVADYNNGTIRKVTPTGFVTTVGSGAWRSPGEVIGVAVDGSGTVVFTEGDENRGLIHRISKITANGGITTLAGSALLSGTSDGTGDAARFYNPSGVAVDGSGNVFVADTGNHTIRRITPAGVVTTVAGLAEHWGSNDGTSSDARFFYPGGIAVDANGNLIVADNRNYTIRKISPGGLVTTLAGSAGSSGRVDGAGNAARFRQLGHLALDGSGNVFVIDGQAIRKITVDGIVTTVAAWDSTARVFPRGVAVDDAGRLFMADFINNTISRGVAVESVPPALITQPQNQTVVRGRIAVFNVAASGSPPPSYQWKKDGTTLSDATDATLLLTNVTPASAGTYQCVVTNSAGSAVTRTAILTVVDSMDTGRFSNFSVRSVVSGGRDLVAGFVVDGPRQKNVLIRGIGPALGSFGVPGSLPDPILVLIGSAGERLAENDNWPATLGSVFASVGAFALPAGSKDAALLLPLQPGAYTVVLSAANAGGGEALIEIYEVP